MSPRLTPAPYWRIKLENRSKHCSNHKINVKTKLRVLPIKKNRIHNIFILANVIQWICFAEMLQYRFYHLPTWRVTFVIRQKSDPVWLLWILHFRFLTTQIKNPKLQSDITPCFHWANLHYVRTLTRSLELIAPTPVSAHVSNRRAAQCDISVPWAALCSKSLSGGRKLHPAPVGLRDLTSQEVTHRHDSEHLVILKN